MKLSIGQRLVEMKEHNSSDHKMLIKVLTMPKKYNCSLILLGHKNMLLCLIMAKQESVFCFI